jgi:hypothetical protein
MDFNEIIMNWGLDDNYYNRGFGLYHFAKNASKPFIKNSEAYMIQFINNNLKSNVLETKSLHKEVYITASKAGTVLRVIILNKGEEKTLSLNLSDFSKLSYMNNVSMGKGVVDMFTTIDTKAKSSNPALVKSLNTLTNQIKVTKIDDKYQVVMPKNTITVLNFKAS